MMSSRAQRARRGVTLMLVSSLALCAFGLVMVYSASSVQDYRLHGDSARHLAKQAAWLAIGLGMLVVASRVDLRLSLRRVPLHKDAMLMSWVIWGASVAGLVMVLVTGVERLGAKRWIQIGSMSVQPSEFAKLGCVMLTAAILALWKRGGMTGLDAAQRIIATSAVVLALVMMQPDMGTAVTIAAGVFVVLLLAGVDGRVLGGLSGLAVTAAAAAVAAAPYRVERVMTLVDPWRDPQGAGYQIIQSLYAFGSGGIGGVGLGLSRQKFAYLPMAHTDFIFAIVGEELGLIGTLAVLVVFGAFAVGGFMVASHASSVFDGLLAGGITAVILIQAIVNMGAVTGLLPVTGIPLPFISYGGSSLIFTLACVGLVIGVARRAERRPAAVKGSRRSGDPAGSWDVRAVPGAARRKGSIREIPLERRRDRGAHLSSVDRRGAARERRA